VSAELALINSARSIFWFPPRLCGRRIVAHAGNNIGNHTGNQAGNQAGNEVPVILPVWRRRVPSSENEGIHFFVIQFSLRKGV
jgi:hypothetical protein